MSKCNIPDTNPLNEPCNPAVTPTATTNSSCVVSPNGDNSCPVVENCSPFSIVDFAQDFCIINGFIQETLNIAGAIINVYKLLGVHEQNLDIDLTQSGTGRAISNGFIPNYSDMNAFDKTVSEWRSNQLGADVIGSAFIGYDFGEFRLSNGRLQYGLETFVRNDVATIKIVQGCDAKNRVTKIRVERSDDGKKWFGVKILDVADCDGLVTLNFNKSVPSRYWRIRPIKFNGGVNDWWSVKSLQLSNFEKTDITNIQDRIFMENRDRDYAETPISIKGSYTPLQLQAFQSKFGNSNIFSGSESYSIEISFSTVVAALGRPLVIGDVIQLPSETQFTPSLKPVLKYLEVTDIAWSSGGYTPNWKPTLQTIIADPVIASQEMQDILGKLTEDIDTSGLIDINNGDNTKTYQDLSDISQTIKTNADTQVPETGEDYGEITKLSDEAKQWAKDRGTSLNKIDRIRNLFGIDAMPPNGLPYTQGDDFPKNPKDKDFHRLTYKNLAPNIPARLYRYSAAKKDWIYLETDRRFEHKDANSGHEEFLDPGRSSRTDPRNTPKDF